MGRPAARRGGAGIDVGLHQSATARTTYWPTQRRPLKPIVPRPPGSGTLLASPEALLLRTRRTPQASDRGLVLRTLLSNTPTMHSPRPGERWPATPAPQSGRRRFAMVRQGKRLRRGQQRAGPGLGGSVLRRVGVGSRPRCGILQSIDLLQVPSPQEIRHARRPIAKLRPTVRLPEQSSARKRR